MAGENLENVGNVAYEHKPRIVTPSSFVDTPSLVLKFYEMNKIPQGPLGTTACQVVRNSLRKMIESQEIPSLSGLGFSIISEGYLNVGVWDKQDPIILKNKLFTFDYDNLTQRLLDGGFKLNLQDTKEFGSFCAFELAIVAHERKAWMEYLISGRTGKDKELYLSSRIEGELR